MSIWSEYFERRRTHRQCPNCYKQRTLPELVPPPWATVTGRMEGWCGRCVSAHWNVYHGHHLEDER